MPSQSDRNGQRARARANTRRCRARRKRGAACYSIEVDESVLDLAERVGVLPRDFDDRPAMARGVEKLLYRAMDALIREITRQR